MRNASDATKDRNTPRTVNPEHVSCPDLHSPSRAMEVLGNIIRFPTSRRTEDALDAI